MNTWCEPCRRDSLTSLDPCEHAPMAAQKFLTTAGELVSGDRQNDYGPPETNFARIAELWSVVLGTKVEPWQVALCMAQLKIARLVESPDHVDSWVDGAAYVGLGGQLAGVKP